MGYHITDIPRGKYEEASKIEEEYAEWLDARAQGCAVMELVELSDMLGAIDAYVANYYNMTIHDLIIMSKITTRVFKDGTRKANT